MQIWINTEMKITSRGSPLAHAYHVWLTYIRAIMSYIGHRLNNRTNRNHNSASAGEVITVRYWYLVTEQYIVHITAAIKYFKTTLMGHLVYYSVRKEKLQLYAFHDQKANQNRFK